MNPKPALSALEAFIANATAATRRSADPADCVLAVAPLMLELIERASGFLEPQHYRSDPDHYARNLVYDAPDASLSLYTLVWLPGQWRPMLTRTGVAEGMAVRGVTTALGKKMMPLAVSGSNFTP